MSRPTRDLAKAARERLQRRRMRAFLRWVAASERCSTCAYRQGTEASGDVADRGLTRVRLALLDAAQPFYCHEDGPIPGKKRLCIGHMSAMTTRYRAGYYEKNPPSSPEVLAELAEATRVRDELYNAWEIKQLEAKR